MSILDLNAVNNVLEIQYTQSKVYNLCYPMSPLWAKMKKKTNFVGQSKVVAFNYGTPQGRGASFSVALGNMSASLYSQVVITRSRDYAFAQIAGETIRAASGQPGALLDTVKREFDNAFYTVGRSIANSLFQTGGGARGQISSGTVLSGTTITLADVNQIVMFERGMVLNLSATDGTSGTKRTGTLTVTAVNRSAGQITVGAAINTVTGAANGDYIFQNGDFETVRSLPTGIPGWIPKVAPTTGDNFFGLDRSVDVTRLAGLRYTAGAGGPIEETLIQAAALLAREGAKPDFVVMNPIAFANLQQALGSKVIYDRLGSKDAPAFGFDVIKMMAPMGPLTIVADYNCGTGDAWMLTLDTWSFETAGAGPSILAEDGNKMLRDATTDSYIARIGYYGNFICEAPGYNCYVAL